MSRIENQPSDQLTVGKPHDDVAVETRTDAQLLNDKELEAVTGGTIRALGGPDTGPQAAGKPQICIATFCYEWPL